MALGSGGLLAKGLNRRYVIAFLLVMEVVIVAAVAFRLSDASARRAVASRNVAVRQPAGNPDSALHLFLPNLSTSKSQERRVAPRTEPVVPVELVAPAPPAYPTALQAKIEIVWPHDNLPLRQADLANVTVYLIDGDGARSVACAAEYTVRLWAALNTGAARPIGVGAKRLFRTGGQVFPVWDFNDVDVSAARDPANRILFYASVDGVPTRHNVWVHATDARTVFPRADEASEVTTVRPRMLDARIEIFWPHADLPADRATLANVTAYLFDAHSRRALASNSDWLPEARLHWALNNDADRGIASSLPGQPRPVHGANGTTFLAWDFNDVDISAASNSLNKVHFWLSVDNAPALTNVWTHGAVAPTVFPQADVLTSCQ